MTEPPACLSGSEQLAMTAFGEWLEGMIALKKLKQKDVAERAGVSSGAISRILAGTMGVDRKTVLSIADALEVSRGEGIRAWLSDDLSEEERDTFTYVQDADAGRLIESYDRLRPDYKEIVWRVVESMGAYRVDSTASPPKTVAPSPRSIWVKREDGTAKEVPGAATKPGRNIGNQQGELIMSADAFRQMFRDGNIEVDLSIPGAAEILAELGLTGAGAKV